MHSIFILLVCICKFVDYIIPTAKRKLDVPKIGPNLHFFWKFLNFFQFRPTFRDIKLMDIPSKKRPYRPLSRYVEDFIR